MKTKKPGPKAQVIHVRNRLKEKAQMGAAPSADGSTRPQIDQAALDKMEAAFEKATEDYPDLVQDYLKQLDDAIKAIEDGGLNEARREKLHWLAHEFRGQGSTFGYPLVTAVGRSLYDFSKKGIQARSNIAALYRAHLDTLRLVIDNRVHGDGGQVGQQIVQTLKKAVIQYSKSKA